MAKVQANSVLAWFYRMYDEHWSYKPNASEQGCVDCSGAFHFVYEKLGGYMPHGSNAMARKYTINLMTIAEAKKTIGIKAKMVAYKVRKQGDKYYALPDKYKVGGSDYNGDLNDYYHVGLIGEDGKVLNAKSEKSGFVKSDLSEGWTHVGYLANTIYEGGIPDIHSEPKQDDSEKKEETPMKMYVSGKNAQKDTTSVNVRQSPSTTAMVLTKLPFGTVVTQVSTLRDWSKIECSQVKGWMMSKFLEPYEDDSSVGSSETPSGNNSDLAYRVAMLEDRLDAFDHIFAELEERVAKLDGEGVG